MGSNNIKLAVVGSRSITDSQVVEHGIQRILDLGIVISVIVSGGCSGPDTLGANWAEQHNIPCDIYLPDWDKYGMRAGFVRNEDIVKNSDMVLAIWDGKSKGTEDSMNHARILGKPLITVYPEDILVEDW